MAILRPLLWAFAALLAYLVGRRLITGFTNPRSHLPGPWYTRFTGIISKTHRLCGTKTQYVHEQFRKYGPIVRLEPDQIAVNDSDCWEEMHRMGSGFRKTEFHAKLRVGVEPMLFSLIEPREHTARRKLFSRAMTQDALRRDWEAQVRAQIEVCVAKIRKGAESGVIDVLNSWRLMTVDTIALLSFGEPFNMLETDGKSEEEYFQALGMIGVNVIVSDMFPFLPKLAQFLPFKRLRFIFDSNRIITEKGGVAVQNLRKIGLDRPNLFSKMLAEAEKTKAAGENSGNTALSDDVIRSDVAGFLLAGSDTTSMSLTYIVWAVLKKPELQRRLEEEVARLDPAFTDKDLEGLSLLNNVIDEALRLYNPASGPNPRRAPPQGVTWKGYFIPGRSMVFTQQYSLSRNEDLFPNSESFDETRFEHATEKQRRVAQPFMIGSRSCIGVALAKMELRLATALFFRECKGARLGKDMTDDGMTQLMKFFVYPKGNKCDITLVEELGQ